MKIEIKLLKNFVTQYNRLQSKYGTEIASLNGFGDEQLSYTDFINNFIDEQTVADASIDSNSNVSHKDIVTLEREMPKPHSKLLAFNKIYDKSFIIFCPMLLIVLFHDEYTMHSS